MQKRAFCPPPPKPQPQRGERGPWGSAELAAVLRQEPLEAFVSLGQTLCGWSV